MLRALTLVVLAVQALAPSDVAFEAASVKPNRDGGQVRITYHPGGRLVVTNVTLRHVVRDAWRVHDLQLQGGPSWITRDTFDIVATAGWPEALTPQDAPQDRCRRCCTLQQQLGLKLEPVRAGFDVLVIDAADRPTAD